MSCPSSRRLLLPALRKHPQTATKHLFVTGGVVSSLGKGLDRVEPRAVADRPRPAGHHAEAGPVPQRRPGHDEPVPARRGVRHRRRRRDRPRRRSLRAVPRPQPVRLGECDHRPGVFDGDRQGAPRRVSRRHRPGHPAHHRRDQEPHPGDGRTGRRRQPARRGDHRDRRHRRRHRVAAVPRGRPPGAPRSRPRELLLPALLAGAVHGAVGRAEDQAHPALGGRAAQHRYHPRRVDPALRPRRSRTAEEQDRADVRRRHRRGDLDPGCAVDLRHPQGAAPRRARRLRGPPAQPAVPRRRLDAVERSAAARARAAGDRANRVGGQVHRPVRRLPVGRRGAAGRRLQAPRQGRDAVGGLRRLRDRRRRRGRTRRRPRAC